jgi:hypothetical protein
VSGPGKVQHARRNITSGIELAGRAAHDPVPTSAIHFAVLHNGVLAP